MVVKVIDDLTTGDRHHTMNTMIIEIGTMIDIEMNTHRIDIVMTTIGQTMDINEIMILAKDMGMIQ